jgi:hypothetical protein
MLSHGACWCDVVISHVKPVMAERHGTIMTALVLLVFMMVLALAMLVAFPLLRPTDFVWFIMLEHTTATW